MSSSLAKKWSNLAMTSSSPAKTLNNLAKTSKRFRSSLSYSKIQISLPLQDSQEAARVVLGLATGDTPAIPTHGQSARW
jgi:hypothetical protein